MENKKIKVHFICNGNAFRSRLAEAYLNSKQMQDLEATSSGITADRNINGPITWYAMRIIANNNLINFMSAGWTKTNQDIISTNDLIVFMAKEQFDHCQNWLGNKKYEIWNIDDIQDADYTDDEHIICASENIYNEIVNKVDGLIKTHA